MKKEIEISGKTREEAIEKAVIELGAPSASAIMYTVINEGRKGFLGFGAVDCTIKAVYQVAEPAEEKPRRERRDHDRRDGDRRDGDRRDSEKRESAPKRERTPKQKTSDNAYSEGVTIKEDDRPARKDKKSKKDSDD